MELGELSVMTTLEWLMALWCVEWLDSQAVGAPLQMPDTGEEMVSQM